MALPALKTVYKENHDKNYTIIGNNLLRIQLPNDNLNAKEVLLYALSCKGDWIFTADSIAKHFRLINPGDDKNKIRSGLRKIRIILATLIEHGYCRKVIAKNPKTGQYSLHHYFFYETPQTSSPEPKKWYMDKTGQTTENKQNPGKNPCTKKVVHGTFNNNNKKQTTTTPAENPPKPESLPPENGVAVAAAEIKKFRKKLDPLLNQVLNDSTVKQLTDKPIEHIEQCNDRTMKAKGVKNRGGFFMSLVRGGKVEDKLKPVDIPENATMVQVRCIKCYNANTQKEEPTCNSIRPDDGGIRKKPVGFCEQFCPFVLQNKELFE